MDSSSSTAAESTDLVSLKTLMPVNTAQLEYDELEPLPEWKLPSLKPSDIYSGLSIFHLSATTSIHICESVVPVANEEDIHGIGAKLLLGFFDLRHTKLVTDCIISAMETSLHDGPVFHNVFPNFPVSLTDPHINQILKICLKTQGIHMLSGSHSLALQYRVMYRTTNTLTPAVHNGRLVGQTIVMHSSPNSKQITHEVIEWDKVSFPANWLVDIHAERKALPRSLPSQKSVRELSSTSARLSFLSPNPEQVSHSSSPSTSSPVHVNSLSLSNNSLLSSRSLSNSKSFLDLPSSIPSEILLDSVKPFHSDYVPNIHSSLLRTKSLRHSLPIPEVASSSNPARHVHYSQPATENSLENQRSLKTTMMSMESTSSKDEWYTTPKYGHKGYRESQFPVYSSFDKWSSCETSRSQHLYSHVEIIQEDTIQEEQPANVLPISEEQSLNVLSDTSGITLDRMMEDDATTSEPLHANIRTQNLQTQYYKINGNSSDQEIREVLHSMFGWYATQIESLHKDPVDVTRLITNGFIGRLREWWDTVLPASQKVCSQLGVTGISTPKPHVCQCSKTSGKHANSSKSKPWHTFRKVKSNPKRHRKFLRKSKTPKCYICQGPHYSNKCPQKGTLKPKQKLRYNTLSHYIKKEFLSYVSDSTSQDGDIELFTSSEGDEEAPELNVIYYEQDDCSDSSSNSIEFEFNMMNLNPRSYHLDHRSLQAKLSMLQQQLLITPAHLYSQRNTLRQQIQQIESQLQQSSSAQSGYPSTCSSSSHVLRNAPSTYPHALPMTPVTCFSVPHMSPSNQHKPGERLQRMQEIRDQVKLLHEELEKLELEELQANTPQ
eukprot:Gb_35857 [translate_table: standard]